MPPKRVPGVLRPAGLLLALLLVTLAYFVALTDPDWFNAGQVAVPSVHHEQLGLVLLGIAILAPFAHPRDFHVLTYTSSLLLAAWFVSMVVVPS